MENPTETPTFVHFQNVAGSHITLKLSEISYLEAHRDRFVIHIAGPVVINVDKLAFDMVADFCK